MKAAEFYSELLCGLARRGDVTVKTYKLKYPKREFDFLRIASKRMGLKDGVILIRAGIHGDEIAGPMTILNHANEIIDLIHNSGLKIILYPLGNPRGFEEGVRYNVDYREGDPCNNDFLRYELEDGRMAENIGRDDKFKKWHWLSDVYKKLKIKLPAETRLMHKLLKKDPLRQVVAFLDLHQDFKTPNMAPAAYHYSFGNLDVYEDIVRRIRDILMVSDNIMSVDDRGFITKHDGSLDDLMYRLGVKYCVTCETTGATPQDIADKVNLIWIFGITDLAKGGRYG